MKTYNEFVLCDVPMISIKILSDGLKYVALKIAR